MNRIDELREKCVIMCMGVRQFDEQQFADLLIRECLSAIEKTPRDLAYTSYDYGLVTATIRSAKESVKEHFQI